MTTTDIAIRILKTASCPSLSGKSKLTYEIACSNEAVDDQSEIALRVSTNTGGGFFSDEWLPLAAVEKIVTGATDLTSTTLHPLFKGKSINTAGFLLAVLKHEGAVRLQEGKTRLYELGDFEGFLEATRALMKPVSAKLPAVQSVREAAAAQAALDLVGDKSYVNAALCTPPICNSLDGNYQDVHLMYPAIPADIELGAVLSQGLRVSYDSTLLDVHDPASQPFGLHPLDANTHDPGVVTFDIPVFTIIDIPYAVEAVNWFDGEVDFIVRQPSGGQAWKLRGLIAPDTWPVQFVAEAVAVPEPASLALALAALLGLAVSCRRSTFARRVQHGRNG